MGMFMKGVSLILCCYNSENLIKKTLSAINDQLNQGVSYEIILVDNNCTDGTVEIAESTWSRTDVALSVVREEELGLSFARKRGVAHARYDIISFIDDDNIIEKEWVRKVYHLFVEKPYVGAMGSRTEPLIEGDIPFWFEQYQLNYACGSPLPASGLVKGKRKHLWGAGLSIRREIISRILFDQPPLFLTGRKGHAVLSGDDSEICFRCTLMGWSLWYEKDLTLKHNILPLRLTWKYFCKLNKGFGLATPVISIYKNIIDGKQPLNFSKIVLDTLKRLSIIMVKHNIQLCFVQEGKEYQKDFYNLLGVMISLSKLRKTYNIICHRIMNASQYQNTQRAAP